MDVLICLTVKDGRGGNSVVDGSVVRNCARCDTQVWVSPDGVEHLDKGTSEAVCVQCCLPDLADEAGEIGILPGTIEAIQKHLRKQQIESN